MLVVRTKPCTVFHMDYAKPVTTPMAVSMKLSLTDNPNFENPTLYHSIAKLPQKS